MDKRIIKLYDHLPLAICIIDEKYKIQYSNILFKTLYSTQDGDSYFKVVYGKELMDDKCCIPESFEDGLPYEIEILDKFSRFFNVKYIQYEESKNKRLVVHIGIEITDSKDKDRQLSMLRMFADKSEQGFFTTTLEGNLTYINRKLLQLIGEEKEENVLKKSFYDYYTSATRDWMENDFVKKLQKNHRLTEQVPIIPRKGNAVPVKEDFFLVTEDSGKDVCIAGVVTDMSHTNNSLQVITEKEEQFRILVGSIKEGIWIFNEENKTSFVNDKVAEILGYESYEMSGQPLSNFMEPGRAKTIEMLNEELSFKVGKDRDIDLVRKDGKHVFVNMNISFINDSLGKMSGAIIGVIDVTDRRHMEENIIRQTSVLSTINLFLHEAIGIVTEQDVSDRFLEAVLDITGSEYGVISQLNENDVFEITSINSVETKKECDETYGIDMLTAMRIDNKTRQELIDGKPFFVNNTNNSNNHNIWGGSVQISRLLIIPIKKGLEILGMIAVANKAESYEITDVMSVESISIAYIQALNSKVLEVERQKMKDELIQSQKMEAVGQLAGGIAHDFNNLLTHIMGNADLLLNDMQPEDKGYNMIKGILNASEEASELSMKILSFARRDKLSINKVHINEIVKRTVSILNKSLMKKIIIVTNYFDTDEIIKVDVSQIQQSLLNICSNGCDAMNNGGVLNISTFVVNESHCDFETKPFCVVKICDNGPGISDNIIDKIFQPFFSTKGVGKGSGLGLSVTHGIIANHGGHIKVSSTPGRGACFEIYIPIYNDADKEANSAKVIKRKQVLLVDDEQYVLDTTKLMLENEGYVAIAAQSGVRAIEIYRERWKDVDVVLLDMIMPGVDGKEVFINIKKINPDAKVIIVSGYFADEEVARMIYQGAIGYLQKPFLLKQLHEMLDKALDCENQRENIEP